MDYEAQSIDVLKLRGNLSGILKNHNINTVGQLIAHATGATLPPLFCLPSIGQERYAECVLKACKWLSIERFRVRG